MVLVKLSQSSIFCLPNWFDMYFVHELHNVCIERANQFQSVPNIGYHISLSFCLLWTRCVFNAILYICMWKNVKFINSIFFQIQKYHSYYGYQYDTGVMQMLHNGFVFLLFLCGFFFITMFGEAAQNCHKIGKSWCLGIPWTSKE